MPKSGGPGQQAIPKAISAMPATRATGTGDAGELLAQQQLADQRGSDQQRQSCGSLADGGELSAH